WLVSAVSDLGSRRSVAQPHGANTPWTANGVLSPAVLASLSAPPSLTLTCPSVQFARAPETTEPGTIALKLDVSEQLAPIVVEAVAVQGTANRNGVSATVPGSSWLKPFWRSVMSTV